jgi:biopolymer transport protein ExbD
MAFDVARASGPRSQVNVTPLIDVVLVLLIIFMVITPTTMKHMKPTVAQESSQVTPPRAGPVLVRLSAGGQVAVDGQGTDWGRLPGLLRERLASSAQSAVFFEISDDVDYGRAVRLMDLCRGAGAKVLALPQPRSG